MTLGRPSFFEYKKNVSLSNLNAIEANINRIHSSLIRNKLMNCILLGTPTDPYTLILKAIDDELEFSHRTSKKNMRNLDLNGLGIIIALTVGIPLGIFTQQLAAAIFFMTSDAILHGALMYNTLQDEKEHYADYRQLILLKDTILNTLFSDIKSPSGPKKRN